MTEDLLQQLEQKMVALLEEVESLRNGVQRLNQENSALKVEKEKYINERMQHEKRLADMLALLESVNNVDMFNANANFVAAKPVLVQVE